VLYAETLRTRLLTLLTLTDWSLHYRVVDFNKYICGVLRFFAQMHEYTVLYAANLNYE